MGDIFRVMLKENGVLGRIIKGYVEAGLLVPDIIVVEVLKDSISNATKGKGFILDGYPRTLAQAEALEKIAKIDVIIQAGGSRLDNNPAPLLKKDMQGMRHRLQSEVPQTSDRRNLRQMRRSAVSTLRRQP